MPLYVGLMSGTSADGIDAVLAEIDGGKVVNVRHHLNRPYTRVLRERITSLYRPGSDEIDRLGALDVELGHLFATTTLALLTQAGTATEDIVAIGSHGQTIRHRPRQESPFTLQIGDPNVIAATTGIAVVADFRRRDIALGGQGAPLAPAFHHAAFSTCAENRAVVNIGGIANITMLPADGSVSGYDTGPGNGLMDYWIAKNLGRAYDERGAWASTGEVQENLLNQLLAHPFFTLKPPRSTGREEFSSTWLEAMLEQNAPLLAVDVQATLLELSARSIAAEIIKAPRVQTLYICGGGAYNDSLMARLQELLPKQKITTTAELNVPVDQVEALAFAWLAQQTMAGLSGNRPEVTGARTATILGAIYPA